MRFRLPALIAIAVSLSTGAAAFAASAAHPMLYIKADSGFQTALTAAMLKKHVPVDVTEDQQKADYVLQAAPVNSKDETTGGKIARWLFADCIGINGYSAVSVQLLKRDDSTVVWAYQVRKGFSGPAGIQSLSEAIAKH